MRARRGKGIDWLGAALLAAGCAGSPPSAVAPPTATEMRNPEIGRVDYDAPRVRRLARRGWVEVVAHVTASDDEAPTAARARAIARARQAAVEFSAGVRVRSSLLSFDQIRGADASSLVQALLTTRADALVVDEQLVAARRVQVSGGYRVRVVLRARILDRSQASDPDFYTELALGRTRFLDGEELSLAVRASRDARIYVVAITEDGAALLLPNAQLPDTRVAAGQWLRFPGRDLSERGVRLIARVPEGRDAASEALLVVALRGERSLTRFAPASRTAFHAVDANGAGELLADLLAPLIELPPDAWTFDQAVYEVLAR